MPPAQESAVLHRDRNVYAKVTRDPKTRLLISDAPNDSKRERSIDMDEQ